MAPLQGLSSIGVDVSINSVPMNFVQTVGQLGGAPDMLDVTCLKDKMTHNIPGVQQTDSFPITFLYDATDAESDFVVLKALEEAKTTVPVVVTLPDGSKFESAGQISVHTNDIGVNQIITAQADVALSKDWDWTKGSGV